MSKRHTLTAAEKARAIPFLIERTAGALLSIHDSSKVSDKARAMSKVLYVQGGFGCQTDKIREVMEAVIGEEIPVKNTITESQLNMLKEKNAGLVVVFTKGDNEGVVGLLAPGTVASFLCLLHPGFAISRCGPFHNANYVEKKGISPFVRKATPAEITEFVNAMTSIDEESYKAFHKLITGA